MVVFTIIVKEDETFVISQEIYEKKDNFSFFIGHTNDSKHFCSI